MTRTQSAFAAVFALALAGCGGGNNDTPAPAVPKVHEHETAATARIVIEAESAGMFEKPVEVDNDATASGGRCIKVEGDAGKPNGEVAGENGKKYPARWGAAIYKFNVPEDGQYRIWGRKFWRDGCGNSWTFVVNGGAPVQFGGDGTYDRWDWKAAPALYDLKKGENMLEVLNREAGVKLDKLIVTRDMDYTPQGME